MALQGSGFRYIYIYIYAYILVIYLFILVLRFCIYSKPVNRSTHKHTPQTAPHAPKP